MLQQNGVLIRQKSFQHHIRHCRRTIATEQEYQREDTHVNPLLLIGSSNSVIEGGISNLFWGVEEGSSKVGEKGSSSWIEFDYSGGHNNDVYSELSNKNSDANSNANTEGQIDDSTFHPSLQRRTIALTKLQKMLMIFYWS